MKTGLDLAGGRPGPSGVFGISERDWLSNYRVLKIEGFGGRPPVGGRHGANPPKHKFNLCNLVHYWSEIRIYGGPKAEELATDRAE